MIAGRPRPLPQLPLNDRPPDILRPLPASPQDPLAGAPQGDPLAHLIGRTGRRSPRWVEWPAFLEVDGGCLVSRAYCSRNPLSRFCVQKRSDVGGCGEHGGSHLIWLQYQVVDVDLDHAAIEEECHHFGRLATARYPIDGQEPARQYVETDFLSYLATRRFSW